MYAESAWSRVDSHGWLHGEMIYQALINQQFSRFPLNWEAIKAVLVVMCYPAFVLELIAPFALWSKRIGRYVALSLITMHVVLEILTLVDWWNYMMIAVLTCFLPLNWLTKLPYLRERSS